MLSNLYFLSNYNNYYNREIKRKSTLAEYLEGRDANQLYSIYNYNFEMNDGVVSEVITNFPMGSVVVDFRDHYLVVEEQIPDEPFLSRWFVVETKKIREGQYRVGLRRDLVADFLEPLLAATVYVEKGTLTKNIVSINNMNPLVFNQEQFAANQIKKRETPIKDEPGCKWLVGYLNKNAWVNENNQQIDKTIETFKNAGATPDVAIASLQGNEILNKFLGQTRRYIQSFSADFDYSVPANGRYFHVDASKDSVVYNTIAGPARGVLRKDNVQPPTFSKGLATFGYSNMLAYCDSKFDAFSIDSAEWLSALAMANKIVYTTNDQKYYRLTLERVSAITETYAVHPDNDPIWYDNLFNFATQGGISTYSQKSADNFRITVSWSEGIKLTAIEIDQEGYRANISKDRNRTIHEAFDAFAIPYIEDEPIYIHLENAFLGKVRDTSAALAMAQEMLDVSSEALDLQLLPFCPLPQEMISYYKRPPGHDGPDDPGDDKLYPIITVPQVNVPYEATQIRDIQNTKTFNVIFWLSSTQFSKVISYTDDNNYSSLEEVKCINQLDTWRLESGDYSSSFEFNMARNGGVSYFEIDCAYKPYQPYIHIAPNFGGLYGNDYNDTRGLICSNTNYSLPRLTDAWESYERNNLNYMNSFNRQVQNMDIQRKYQKTSELWSMIGGSIGASGSGAAMGSIAGNAAGMSGLTGGLIGAGVGAAASVGAGIYDLYASNQIYKENKQYAIDQFNMSLQNIQALPNTIAAVGALNPNNKVFPVLSHYTCSDIEREAFKQKMKWNGMTIGALTDNITDYIDPTKKTYFKGNLVYIDTETTDIGTHEMSELANELAKGIIFDIGVIN